MEEDVYHECEIVDAFDVNGCQLTDVSAVLMEKTRARIMNKLTDRPCGIMVKELEKMMKRDVMFVMDDAAIVSIESKYGVLLMADVCSHSMQIFVIHTFVFTGISM